MVEFSPQFGEGLFHGTHRNIEGGSVLPAAKTSHGQVNYYGLSHREHAYATESEDTAWQMASQGQQNALRNSEDPVVPGRTRVHEVYPHPKMEVGRYHPDHEYFRGENLSEHIAPEFKIKQDVDIKPGEQGTFPLNWNQFRANPHAVPQFGDPFNHPYAEHIEHGHRDAHGNPNFGPNSTLETLVDNVKSREGRSQPERLF